MPASGWAGSGGVSKELQSIDTLSANGIKVMLIRRTGQDTIKAMVGCCWPGGEFRGWSGARLPTHWCDLPPMASWMKG